MKIAVVAATNHELEQLKHIVLPPPHELSFFCHGVGIMEATFRLVQILGNKPDLILQCGLAGTYSQQFPVGTTVMVRNEITDTGAEDRTQLLSIFDLGFKNENEFPFQNGVLPCPYLKPEFEWSAVDALTVNCSTGSSETLAKRKERYPGAIIETMEGAAFHYTCLMAEIPFLQLRSISNVVEPRNRAHWELELALKNNAIAVHSILKKIILL